MSYILYAQVTQLHVTCIFVCAKTSFLTDHCTHRPSTTAKLSQRQLLEKGYLQRNGDTLHVVPLEIPLDNLLRLFLNKRSLLHSFLTQISMLSCVVRQWHLCLRMVYLASLFRYLSWQSDPSWLFSDANKDKGLDSKWLMKQVQYYQQEACMLFKWQILSLTINKYLPDKTSLLVIMFVPVALSHKTYPQLEKLCLPWCWQWGLSQKGSGLLSPGDSLSWGQLCWRGRLPLH